METDLFSRTGDEQALKSEASLRPAVARLFVETKTKVAQTSAGGFHLASATRKRSSDFSRAMTTCILALYPVVASAAVIIAGLLLSGGSAAS